MDITQRNQKIHEIFEESFKIAQKISPIKKEDALYWFIIGAESFKQGSHFSTNGLQFAYSTKAPSRYPYIFKEIVTFNKLTCILTYDFKLNPIELRVLSLEDYEIKPFNKQKYEEIFQNMLLANELKSITDHPEEILIEILEDIHHSGKFKIEVISEEEKPTS